MRIASTLSIGLLGLGLVLASCGSDRIEKSQRQVVHVSAAQVRQALPESSEVQARVDALRERFRVSSSDDALPSRARTPARASAARAQRPVLSDGVVVRFETSASNAASHVHAVVATEAKRGVARTANVALPLSATGAVKLEDDSSKVAVAFSLTGTRDVQLAVSKGIALYPKAYGGQADVVHRVHAEGTEDYVVFEERPAIEALRYELDVARVPGLRLVSNTLEFLDEAGTPRLRVAPPYVADASGRRHEAKLAVDGCMYDVNPRGPWGRPVTPPMSTQCSVTVRWSGARYPVVVDPAWVSTGALSFARASPAAALLQNGKVLVLGGQDAAGAPIATAELYDPATGTFSATGAMGAARSGGIAVNLNSGKVLVTGGNAVPNLKSAEVYDPAMGLFASTGDMGTNRAFHTATLLASGKVLIAGGSPNDGITAILSTTEYYDPTGASFAPGPAMNLARESHSAVTLTSGMVLFVGGYGVLAPPQNGTGSIASAELFAPQANGGAGAFTVTGSMSTVRGASAAVALPLNKAIVIGGMNERLPPALVALGTTDVFDLAAAGGAGAFGLGPALVTPRLGHAAVVLLDGRIVVIGGNDGASNAIPSSELLDSAVTTFRSAGSAVVARAVVTAAVRLATGKVLVAGGPSFASTAAELFDLVTSGGTCSVAGECKSGVCEDGICCAGACSGTCKTCTAGTGACVAVTSADDPDTCTGTSTCGPTSVCVANTYCTSDAKCFTTHYCDAAGLCKPRKAQGTACNVAAGADCKVASCGVCATGFCADGVCCDGACNATCVACAAALKQSGAADGACGPAKDGTNPHSDPCPLDPTASCAHDGKCNGAGACRSYYPAGTGCGANVCNGSSATGLFCNGAGQCLQSPGVNCDPFPCVSGVCATTCTTNADCSADAFCNAKHCEKKLANGQACTSQDSCTSNICVDGVCCNAACSGQCEACDVAGAIGTCSTVSGAPHAARPACVGQGTSCSGSCDGTKRGECDYPAPTVACTTSCTDNKQIDSVCDGKGACIAGAPRACADNLTCDTTQCKARCASDADCVASFHCQADGKCGVPAPADGSGDAGPVPAGDVAGCSTSPGAPSGGAPFAVAGLLFALTFGRKRRKRHEDRGGVPVRSPH